MTSVVEVLATNESKSLFPRCGLYVGSPATPPAGHRVYTQSACASIGGQWFPNDGGECRYDGGSFSYDCRGLNNDPLDVVWRYKYVILGTAVVGGYLVWKRMK